MKKLFLALLLLALYCVPASAQFSETNRAAGTGAVLTVTVTMNGGDFFLVARPATGKNVQVPWTNFITSLSSWLPYAFTNGFNGRGITNLDSGNVNLFSNGVLTVQYLFTDTATFSNAIFNRFQWSSRELLPSSAVTNFIPDFTTTNRQTIFATGNVFFANFVNLADGVPKTIFITNRYSSVSNISVYAARALNWFGTNSGCPVTETGTNFIFTVTNSATLYLDPWGATVPSVKAFLRHQL